MQLQCCSAVAYVRKNCKAHWTTAGLAMIPCFPQVRSPRNPIWEVLVFGRKNARGSTPRDGWKLWIDARVSLQEQYLLYFGARSLNSTWYLELQLMARGRPCCSPVISSRGSGGSEQARWRTESSLNTAVRGPSNAANFSEGFRRIPGLVLVRSSSARIRPFRFMLTTPGFQDSRNL